jgi:hypothetical protein
MRYFARHPDESGIVSKDVLSHLGIRLVAQAAQMRAQLSHALLTRIAVMCRRECVGVEVVGIVFHPRLERVANHCMCPRAAAAAAAARSLAVPRGAGFITGLVFRG